MGMGGSDNKPKLVVDNPKMIEINHKMDADAIDAQEVRELKD
jgi:hypothetical protein